MPTWPADGSSRWGHLCQWGIVCCSTKETYALKTMITYLDLQANPAASAIIMVDDYVEVLWHLASNAPILDVNAPQRHGRHLVESQRLHMQALVCQGSHMHARHLAANLPVLDINAPQRHGRHLVECQCLHMQAAMCHSALMR